VHGYTATDALLAKLELLTVVELKRRALRAGVLRRG
jgi:hypothetical protein